MEEQKKKTNIKKVLGGVLALVLVAVISVVGTLAYLGSTTGTTKDNIFTGSDDISVQLTETDWDKTGTGAKGEEKAEHYTPGLKIEKNPVITNNTSTTGAGDYSEWVAMRVDYQIQDSTGALVNKTKEEFTGASGVVSSFNDSAGQAITDYAARNWIKVMPKTSTTAKFDIYVYKVVLPKDNSTNSLFDSVTLKDPITKVTIGGNQKYPQFKINILGAAIKNEIEFGTISDLSTGGNLTYAGSATKTANDYIIMNELVKLLTSDDEYQAFTGLKKDGSAA